MKFHAKGTGRTTGHIVDLLAYNPDSNAISVDIGQCFIPSKNNHQAYIVPEITRITVPPFRSLGVQLKGYCVSIDRSPAFSGQILPPVDQWVNWHSGEPLPQPGTPLSAAFKPYSPGMPDEDNFFLNWPNSNDPFYYTLDINEFPNDAVRLLLYFEHAARSTLEKLITSGALEAEDKLKDNYIQHVLWLYVSVLEGKTYPKDQFIAKYVRQWEITNNQSANKMEPDLLADADDVWSNIQLIGAEAKLVEVVVPAYQPAFKQEKTGESIPARSSIIHLINSTDIRDPDTGKSLLPALLFLNEQKSQPEWYSVWLMAQAELNKWLNHTLRYFKISNPTDLDQLIGLLAFIEDDCQGLIGQEDLKNYKTTIHTLLESGIAYLIGSLNIEDNDYLQKRVIYQNYRNSDWYEKCCAEADPLGKLPEKIPSKLINNIEDLTLDLTGFGWKTQPIPFILQKPKWPWIAGTGIPLIGAGTWLAIKYWGGEEPKDTVYPVANPDMITISCNGQETLDLIRNDSGLGIAVTSVSGDPVLTWQITGQGTILISTSGATGVFQGSYQISDENGLIAVSTIQVTVNDQIPPTITCPPDIGVSVNAQPDPQLTGNPIASDNCTPVNELSLRYNDLSEGGPCGIIRRTWTVSDFSGNSSKCDQIIDLLDDVPPVIECPPDLQLAIGSGTEPLQTGYPVVTDNCSASEEIQIQYADQVEGEACGQIIHRTWTATDANNNQASCTQVIRFMDNVAPTIVCPPDIELEYGAGTDPSMTGFPEVADNCTEMADIQIQYTDVTEGEGCGQVITRTWNATDESGNQASCTQVIRFMDNVAPTIICPPDIQTECSVYKSNPYSGDPTVYDNCSNNFDVSFVNHPEEFFGCNGTVIRTWTAVDQSGNAASCNQNIYVTDQTAPYFTFCPPEITVQCGDHWDVQLTGTALAEDACNPMGQPEFTDKNLDFNGCQGTIERTFVADDGCGNKAYCVQHIHVLDTEAPVIICPPDIEVQCGQENDLTITGQVFAEDICTAEPVIEYFDDLSGLIACEGNIIRTFSAGDLCGNTSFCTQIIFVENIPCDFVPIFNFVPDVCERCVGYIEVAVNPSGDYEYFWNTGDEGSGAYNLCSGTYSVTITSLNEGCSDIYSVDVPNLPQLNLEVLEIFHPNNPGNNNGYVRLEVTTPGAQPPYLVYLNDMPIGSANTNIFQIINMSGGEYMIYIVDQNGQGCPSNPVFVFLFSMADAPLPGISQAINNQEIPLIPLHTFIYKSEAIIKSGEVTEFYKSMDRSGQIDLMWPIKPELMLISGFQRDRGIASFLSEEQIIVPGSFDADRYVLGLRHLYQISQTLSLFQQCSLSFIDETFRSEHMNASGHCFGLNYSAGFNWPVNDFLRLELYGQAGLLYDEQFFDHHFGGSVNMIWELPFMTSKKGAWDEIKLPIR